MDIGRPAAVAETLAALIARGVPLEDALPAFTSNVASLLRLSKKGRIAVGADADLVVLDDSHGIRDVMARGRVLAQGGRALVTGTLERAISRA
jgi:beta-aspartyl-dipeptidase (metallo-type)